MDLTCSYPIATALIDSGHEVRGNPECNEQLQPGSRPT
jgi:hypothetical protein